VLTSEISVLGPAAVSVRRMDDQFARVAALVGVEPAISGDAAGLGSDLRRLCTAAGRALGASGVGLTVMARNGVRGVTAATDPTTERLEELQLTLGEGPCMDAFERQHPILVAELADGAMTRWPIYAPAVYEAGVRAVFAFPLQIGAARMGIMDVFRRESGTLSTEDLGLALTFAEVTVATLLDGQGQAPADDGGDGLGEVLGSRTELFQAQGMVMVQLGTNLQEAMARMRAYAYANNRRLSEVAADIVARRLSFDSDRP
jgi:ANTAR domain